MLVLNPGTEEYRRADEKLREAIEAKRKQLPQDRHDIRESAVYVDLESDGARW
ncbi:MAG: hypothetical protein WBR26_07785 [Candidatus Acidiferrum sp.]